MNVVILMLTISSFTYLSFEKTQAQSNTLKPALNTPSIVGGKPASIRTYPFMVYLLMSPIYLNCDGTIFGIKFVLTAAHCLLSYPSLIHINVGSTTYFGGKGYVTNLFAMHPSFDRFTGDYDVGIVKSKTSLLYDKIVTKAIELAAFGSAVVAGTTVDVVGWGTTKDDPSSASNSLRSVKIPVVNIDWCRSAYRGIYEVSSRMFCASFPRRGGKSPCIGDSGGPAIDNNGIQVGIVSSSSGCGAPGFPSVYTDVSSMRAWIQGETGV